MAFAKLDESLTLDHAIIDQDHQSLFEAIQQVVAQIDEVDAGEDDAAWQDRIKAEIGGLREATLGHFRSEEAIMRMGAYPGIDAHHHQHVLLIAELDKFLAGKLVPGTEGSRLAVAFLGEWFEFHIRIWDSALVRWLNGCDGRRSGVADGGSGA